MTAVGTPSMDFQPGVKIPEVLRASAGQRAGLQAGDIVLGLNGQPLTPSPYSVARTVAFIRCQSESSVMPPAFRSTDVFP